MWIHVFPVWPPPSCISEWYWRALPLTKTLSSPNKKPYIQRYFIQPYHAYQGCFLRATILLNYILDEFHQSKLIIWCHAYCGHVMLKSWNRCCPVENLFVHSQKIFLSYLFRQKVTQQRVLWGYFSPICNTRVKAFRMNQISRWRTISIF